MTNLAKRASVALALVAGTALSGCATVEGMKHDVVGMLPNSGPTSSPVEARVAGVVADSAAALPPGVMVDVRGYQRYRDNGAVVPAAPNSCSELRTASAAANRQYGTDQYTGRQVAGGISNAAGRATQVGIAGAVNGDPRTLQRAGTAAAGGIGTAVAGGVSGFINGAVNKITSGNAEQNFQAAYLSCGQSFAAKVDAQCAARAKGDRNAPGYATCFETGIVNNPAPARVPTRVAPSVR